MTQPELALLQAASRESIRGPSAAENCGVSVPSKKKKLILLADDEEEFRTLFKEIAKKRGYSCEVVTSADEFFSHLKGQKRSKPDLIVLDIQMEDEDAGLRVLDQIKGRKQGRLRSTPTIMVSQSLKYRDVCESYRRGASVFIRKTRDQRANRANLNEALKFWNGESIQFCDD